MFTLRIGLCVLAATGCAHLPPCPAFVRPPRRDYGSQDGLEKSFESELRDFGEAPLTEGAPGGSPTYRVMSLAGLELPTRSGDWVIRVQQRADGALLEIKQPTTMCEKDGRKSVAVRSRTIPIDDATWARIVSCMDRNFWNAPAVVEEMPVTDGNSVSIEGIRDGHYQNLHRSSFIDLHGDLELNPLGKCVERLTKLAGLR